MKLNELLKSGFGKNEHYTEEEKARYGNVNMNCCERILHGSNKAYGLGLSDEALKVSAPFGGGMGIGSVCGAVTGSLMVLSLRYGHATEKQIPLKEEITLPFIKKVKAAMGDINCKVLKPRYSIPEPFSCDPVVLRIAELLDETIEELDAKLKK